MPEPKEKYTIGIITVLPKEFAAVRAMLEEPTSDYGYETGYVTSKHGGRHYVTLALLPVIGNNQSALDATQLLMTFPNVRNILMVGIAGGAPNPIRVEEDVHLGDIVVSDQYGIVQYDNMKETSSSTEIRHQPRPPSPSFLGAVRMLEVEGIYGSYPWEQHITKILEMTNSERPSEENDVLHSSDSTKEVIPRLRDPQRRSGYPLVFSGPIASANTLLKNPTKRDWLCDTFHVKAVEMESSGVADATWNKGASYMVVRGISDYCDSYKNDIWQPYAAAVAAAYTRALLEEIQTHEEPSLASFVDKQEVPCGILAIQMLHPSSSDKKHQKTANVKLGQFICDFINSPNAVIPGAVSWSEDSLIEFAFPNPKQEDYRKIAELAMFIYHSLEAFTMSLESDKRNRLDEKPDIRLFCDTANRIYKKDVNWFEGKSIEEMHGLDASNVHRRRLLLTQTFVDHLPHDYESRHLIELMDNPRHDTNITGSKFYLYPILEFERCCLYDLYKDDYPSSINISLVPGEDSSDLWYILIKTAMIETVRDKVVDVFNSCNNDNPKKIRSVFGWSLLGARELLIKYRTTNEIARQITSEINEALRPLIDTRQDEKQQIFSINVTNEWVRDVKSDNRKFSLGQMDQKLSNSYNKYRNMKAFIGLNFRMNGMNQKLQRDVEEVLEKFDDIIETYTTSYSEHLGMTEYMIIEAHLPCGHLFRLQELSAQLEPTCANVKETYLTYSGLNLYEKSKPSRVLRK